MDTLFLIVHTSTFNITLQALTLINHVVNSASPTAHPDPSSSSSIAVAARYYRTLYATLLDPRLFSSNKQAMYLNLLFKSLKHDTDLERVNAFVKRFCQVLAGGFGGTEFVAGGLWLLGEVSMLVSSLHRSVNLTVTLFSVIRHRPRVEKHGHQASSTSVRRRRRQGRL